MKIRKYGVSVGKKFIGVIRDLRLVGSFRFIGDCFEVDNYYFGVEDLFFICMSCL